MMQATYSSQNLDGTVTLLFFAVLEVAIEELILALLSDTPEMATGPHGHVDDTTSPDIDGTRVEFLVDILFGCNVGS
jgi:hypothetical protein